MPFSWNFAYVMVSQLPYICIKNKLLFWIHISNIIMRKVNEVTKILMSLRKDINKMVNNLNFSKIFIEWHTDWRRLPPMWKLMLQQLRFPWNCSLCNKHFRMASPRTAYKWNWTHNLVPTWEDQPRSNWGDSNSLLFASHDVLSIWKGKKWRNRVIHMYVPRFEPPTTEK